MTAIFQEDNLSILIRILYVEPGYSGIYYELHDAFTQADNPVLI